MTTLRVKIFGTDIEYEGDEVFLRTEVPQLLEVIKKSHNDEVRRNLSEVDEDLRRNLAAVDGFVQNLFQLNDELVHKIRDTHEKTVNFLESIEKSAKNPAAFSAAVKAMKEMQIAFNLEYLQLQSQIQNEARQYTSISNVMKTNHDTLKNSINNVR
jgi:translation elongation factor EF-1beta